MKSKSILVSLIAIFAVILALNLVSALSSNDVQTTVNGMELGSSPSVKVASLEVGSTTPVMVEVYNSGNITLHDVRVKVEVEDADVQVESDLFDMPAGSSRSFLFSIKLPANIENELKEDDTLRIRVNSDDGDFPDASYDVMIQRKARSLDLLSVDVSKVAVAGSTLSIDVVLKNRGSHRLDDTFVVARIPTLGVEKKVYFSDLTPVDQDSLDNGKQDAEERVLSLRIPSDAKAGVYTLEIEAYNDETSTKTTKNIAITGSEQESNIIVPVTSKDVAVGSSVTYDVIIVNSGSRIGVYEVIPETAQNLIVSVDQPVMTIPADSSKTVKVTVQAGNAMGTYGFAVNINSQGQLVKKVNLAANVGKAGVASSNIVILTIILAVVFIVLLIVLIVLLTRKPEKVEEFGESYY